MILCQAALAIACFGYKLKLFAEKGTFPWNELLFVVSGITSASCNGSSSGKRQAIVSTRNLDLGLIAVQVEELKVRAASSTLFNVKRFATVIHAPEKGGEKKRVRP